MIRNRDLALALALVLGVASGLAACASAANTEDAGTVHVQLSTVGSDGALYSLPRSAILTIQSSGSSGGPAEPLSFDGTSGPSTFSVPAGAYTATLSPGLPDGGMAWMLTRSADGGVTSVPATLSDPQPYAFSVTAGGATPLAFHFAISALGSLSFGTGSLTTSVEVDAGTTFSGSSGTFTGTVAMSTDTVSGPSALDDALDLWNPESLSYTLSVTRTGPWAVAADAACSPVGASATALSYDPNVAALVQEVSGGTGQLCFSDASRSGEVDLYLSRTGAPATAAMQSLLPGGGSDTFELRLSGYAPSVFDDTSLALGSLPEPFTVTSAALTATISAGGSVLAVLGSSGQDTTTAALDP